MIRRKVYIEKYGWVVNIFYHVTCYRIDEIMDCLEEIDCPPEEMRISYDNLVSCRLNTGVTYSNYSLRESVIVISKTSSPEEFVNSFKHETRHLEDHIALALGMEAGGEEVAYLSGYLGKILAGDLKLFICDCHCHKQEIRKEICSCNKNRKYEDKSRFKN